MGRRAAGLMAVLMEVVALPLALTAEPVITGPDAQAVASLQLLNRFRADPHGEAGRLLRWERYGVPGMKEPDLALFRQEMAALPAAAPLVFEAHLVAAAQAHASYLVRHKLVTRAVSGHGEDPKLAGFTGALPADRLAAAGYAGGSTGENVHRFAISPYAGQQGLIIEAAQGGFEFLAGPDGRSTWREEQGRCKKLLGPDGRVVDAAPAPQRDDWAQAWLADRAYDELRAIGPPRLIPGLLLDLERLHLALSGLLPPVRTLAGKHRIRMARPADQFCALTQRLPRGAAQGRSFQGFFNPMDGTVCTFTDKVANTSGTPQLRLNHECTHQYVVAMSGLALPPWLHEGFAVVMENLEEKNGAPVFGEPRERLLLLKRIYQQHQKPVREFSTYLSGMPLGNVHQYAEAYAMLHHQVFARADGRERLQTWWREACTGQPAGPAFEQHFLAGGPYAGKSGLGAWQDAVRKHVEGGGAARFP